MHAHQRLALIARQGPSNSSRNKSSVPEIALSGAQLADIVPNSDLSALAR
jgi:hypothetical protein